MPVYNELQLSSYVDQIFKRIQRVERQLALVSEKVGIPFDDPSAAAPPEVLELVGAGDRIGAIKKYREVTGADIDEARAAVEAL
jgi:ribosomal protein L7/L12